MAAPRVVVLVPRRADGGRRDNLWAFARQWWETVQPEWPIFEGHHDDGPFNRSMAINQAAQDAGAWDVAVIIDSDILADRDPVRSAVGVAWYTGAHTLPYHERLELNQHGTKLVLEGFDGNWLRHKRVALHNGCSSVNVIRRDLFDTLGGYDELFVGWGYEDVAFRIASEVISGLEVVKIYGRIWHLWHPAAEGNNRAAHTVHPNKFRCDRYKEAIGHPDQMRLLIDEHLAARVGA